MVGALFDTNILVDYLNGLEQAKAEMDRYSDRAISMVTCMEVMVGADGASEKAVRNFLATFENISVDSRIAEAAVYVRRQNRIKLPDAIILATAQISKRLFVTRNTKDFPDGDPGIRIPYRK